MDLLITGMTAQQANPGAHGRVANYTGFLAEVLEAGGHTVEWGDPHIDHDLGKYEGVIVGVAPITSLGANRAYGALSIIERLWDSDKLTLFLDAPDPNKIDSSLKAITERPENLTKSFFEYRKEYSQAIRPETTQRLLKAVSWLHTEDWPRTLVPKLPWHTDGSLVNLLPRGARNPNTLMGDLEIFVLEHFESDTAAQLLNPQWAYEPGSNKVWINHLGIQWPMEKIPWSSREEADLAAMAVIHNSSGTLISPHRDGTWWSSRFGMSLAQGVPVFTNWSEAQQLNPVWGTLPMVYETSDHGTREFIARTQLDSYMQAIDTRDAVVASFEHILLGKVDH
jgi:hypothetical protein